MLFVIIFYCFLNTGVWADTPPQFALKTPRYGCRVHDKASCREDKALTDQGYTKHMLREEKLWIFVSLNLTDDTLKKLYFDACLSKIPTQLVLKGLLDNSFVKTAQRLKQLNIKAEIHPQLFERYQIDSVPSFVLEKPKKEAVLVKGHVSLSFVLEKMRQADAL